MLVKRRHYAFVFMNMRTRARGSCMLCRSSSAMWVGCVYAVDATAFFAYINMLSEDLYFGMGIRWVYIAALNYRGSFA